MTFQNIWNIYQKNSFVGEYYGDNFLCIENRKLITEADKYFKIKMKTSVLLLVYINQKRR